MFRQLRNRVISREHFARLPLSLQRLAKGHKWDVRDNPNPADPRLITLRDLGREPAPAPSLDTPETELTAPAPVVVAAVEADGNDAPLPTIEEYVNAGYPVNRYAEFLENEKDRRNAIRLQLEQQRQELAAQQAKPEKPSDEDDVLVE